MTVSRVWEVKSHHWEIRPVRLLSDCLDTLFFAFAICGSYLVFRLPGQSAYSFFDEYKSDFKANKA